MPSYYSLLFLTLFFASVSSSVKPNDADFLLSSAPKSPMTMAEKLIRQLNLFPKHEINKVTEDFAAASEQGLFEKKLNLSYIGDSGATVQNLGHHAGYYRLPHTKDARFELN